MSAPPRTAGSAGTERRRRLPLLADADPARGVALGGVTLLMAAYVSVLYRLVDVTADPLVLVVEAAVAVGAATYFSQSLRARAAGAVAVGLFVLGLAAYVSSLPRQPSVEPLLADAVALTTGRTLLQVTNVDLWVLGVAPGPLFLTWYLGLRRRYVSAALVGGATLSFLVLTTDAGGVTTLLGVVGGTVAVGVGDVERRGEDIGTAESLAVVLALMILLPAFATVVPGGPSGATVGLSGLQAGAGAGGGTIEASLVDADSEITVQGATSLSPEVRFRVESDARRYWQVDAYDRYTGDGWVRTGGTLGYDGGRLQGPPGESRTVEQEYTLVDRMSVLPAAWRPVRVGGAATGLAQVTGEDGFALQGSLAANDTYTVRSQVVTADDRQLRSAGDDYPAEVAERYTRLPSSTPDRLTDRTSTITANADNPYETARVIERWLENNREYSLNVSRPDGNVADAFLFEMDAGYCTYFATTMVTMLRSQDIPARFVVGYTPGERVDEDEWVVRGYNAHAWVQVYFPEVGWVRFDPTPAGPRRTAEEDRLSQARENGRSSVDMNDTLGTEWTPTPTATPAPLTPPPDREQPIGPDPSDQDDRTPPSGLASGPDAAGETGTTDANASDSDGGPVVPIEWPTRQEATLILIALFGVAVAVRRAGVATRLYRALWVRYQPRRDPTTDAERAFHRLEYLLAERYRPRDPGETPRQYLASVGADERARSVTLVYERARYAGSVTREEAVEAIEAVDDLVGQRPSGR